MERATVCLALLLFAAVSQAQDVDSFEPTVDTSASVDDFEPAVDTSVDESAATVDAFEPAVDTSSGTTQDEASASSTGTPNTSGVMDRITLSRTEITGNQELPKVMYIVPWKKSDPSELVGRPVNTLLDEVLAPIDREEFIREVAFYGDLYGNSEE